MLFNLFSQCSIYQFSIIVPVEIFEANNFIFSFLYEIENLRLFFFKI